ncbi:MAG: hypothetical protein PHN73_08400 [Eubacteriales bacterium]|nr:hypothetical protein [Eubacteriales bacterium]
MKFKVRCYACDKELDFEITNDLLQKLVCDCCKTEQNIFLQNDPYQIFFDMGVISCKKDFFIEAVVYFSLALERYYEHAIKGIFSILGICEDDICGLWKEMENQSERQYSSFITLFLIVCGEVKPEDTKMKAFRNSVVHKGRIPSRKQTKDFGKYVYDRIYYLQRLLFYKEAVDPAFTSKTTHVNNEIDNIQSYISAIDPFSLVYWNDNGERIVADSYKPFEDMYQEFYKNNEFVVPYG